MVLKPRKSWEKLPFPLVSWSPDFSPSTVVENILQASCQPDQETVYLAAFCRENQAGCLNLPSTNLTIDFSHFYTRILPFAKTRGAMGSSQFCHGQRFFRGGLQHVDHFLWSYLTVAHCSACSRGSGIHNATRISEASSIGGLKLTYGKMCVSALLVLEPSDP